MYARNLASVLLKALANAPVVVLHGPRQCGKTTLVQSLAKQAYPARYITLDRMNYLSASRSDPEGFLAGLQPGPVIIDEIQRAPELLLAIKADVDADRRAGRYLLTGSAHVLHLPRLADSLAGRMQIINLWPFSQGELESRQESWIDTLFSDTPLPAKVSPFHGDLSNRMLAGGYPEALLRKSWLDRRDWFESYLETILTRDVKDVMNVTSVVDIPRLLTAMAGRAAALLKVSEVARDVGLNQMTTKRYLALFQTTFLTRMVPPWFTNRSKRLMKSTKLYIGDTGLLSYLQDLTPERIVADRKAYGVLLENFVALELMKQATWGQTRPVFLHYRDYGGTEVDLVLEAPGGRKLLGIEIKSSATLHENDFKGLRRLADDAGKRFCRGIVLYTGSEMVPFGRNLYAMPVSSLWQM